MNNTHEEPSELGSHLAPFPPESKGLFRLGGFATFEVMIETLRVAFR